MSYYNYSVKEKLSEYYGKENTVAALRTVIREDYWKGKDWVPLAWQYADQQTLGHFVSYSKYFLTDTILADDYIVYLTACDTGNMVFIMFMLTQQDVPFRIDMDYLQQIIDYWGNLYDCEVVILTECLQISSGGRIGAISNQAYRGRLYSVTTVNGHPLLTEWYLSCWSFFYKKLLSVAKSGNIREYECLFEPDVKLTEGKDQAKKVLAVGLSAIKDYMDTHAPLNLVYKKDEKGGCYLEGVAAGLVLLNLNVSRRNLISELRLEPGAMDAAEVIVDTTSEGYGSLCAAVPELHSVRPLDVAQIHGYGLRLSYADGEVRHYYLRSFDTNYIPDECEIDGYQFNTAVLESVSIDSNNGIRFDNGYVIAPHILYYRGHRQVAVKQLGTVEYESDQYKITALYQLPLTQFFGWSSFRQYWGRPDECFGAAFADTDRLGNRVSDVTYYHSDRGEDLVQAKVVCVEPSCKYGVLNDDGTWLHLPVYTRFKGEMTDGCVLAERASDGKECMLTPGGQEVLFEYPINLEWFSNGRCPFSTGRWEGDSPDKGAYWEDEDMEAGNWGFIDPEGQIVIKPQYVYVTGFYDGENNYCIVAKMVKGKPLWGVIDRTGTEVVPCNYPYLFSQEGDVLIYQEEGQDLYGLMEFDGTIIIEPQFGCIDSYDRDKGLIIAGTDEETLGVYSIARQAFIVPEKYDYIYLGKDIIECDLPDTTTYVYYDYSGKPVADYQPERDYSGTAEYTQRGLCLTGKGKQKGLADLTGKDLLNPIYSNIRLEGDFIKASQTTDANWSVRSYLYDLEGRPVIKEVCRNLSIDEDATYISAETPAGSITYQIEKKRQN